LASTWSNPVTKTLLVDRVDRDVVDPVVPDVPAPEHGSTAAHERHLLARQRDGRAVRGDGDATAGLVGHAATGADRHPPDHPRRCPVDAREPEGTDDTEIAPLVGRETLDLGVDAGGGEHAAAAGREPRDDAGSAAEQPDRRAGERRRPTADHDDTAGLDRHAVVPVDAAAGPEIALARWRQRPGRRGGGAGGGGRLPERGEDEHSRSCGRDGQDGPARDRQGDAHRRRLQGGGDGRAVVGGGSGESRAAHPPPSPYVKRESRQSGEVHPHALPGSRWLRRAAGKYLGVRRGPIRSSAPLAR
jgi:hypothetical protein